MPEDRRIPVPRPFFAAIPVVLVEGKKISHNLHVESLIIGNEINQIPRATIVLLKDNAARGNNNAGSMEDFLPGRKVEIQNGNQREVKTIFKGIIISQRVKIREGGRVFFTIECRDEVIKMTKGRKSRCYTDMSDSEIWNLIAGNYPGVSLSADSTSVVHTLMVQSDSSDWDFIVKRADVNGRLCITENGTLSVTAPDYNQSPVMSLEYGNTILELDAEIDARYQVNEVIAQGWNPAEQEIVQVKGKDPGVRLNDTVTAADLSDATGAGKILLNQGGNLSKEELQAWSDALMLKRQLAMFRGRVQSKGIHPVKPGHVVALGGVGAPFDGKVYISGVRHNFSSEGWQQDIHFGIDPDWFTSHTETPSKAAAALVPPVNGLQVGKVVQSHDDPAGEYRVKVYLPVLPDDTDGIWCRLASPDAGKERGLVFRPEIGDEVVVGFINDDPRQAVVLGMLYSSARPAPVPADGNNAQKGFTTRSGIRIIFDDEHVSFSVTTPRGNKIVIDESSGSISIVDEEQNKVMLGKKGISLFSNKDIEMNASGNIKFSAMNITGKANGSLKLEGASGASISSSGALVVKGSLVQIN